MFFIFRRMSYFSDGPVSVTFENELPFPNARFHTNENSLDVIYSCLTLHGIKNQLCTNRHSFTDL